MPISQAQREYWSQKNPSEEYNTIIFEHPEFEKSIRLVLDQFVPLKFHGHEYIPVAAKLTPPSQGAELTPKLTLNFSRIHIGDEFKKAINSITPFGWLTPIKMVYEQFTQISMTVPSQKYILYVFENGILFNRTSVQITAGDDNPMILSLPSKSSVNPIYTIKEYRGLARL